MISWLAKKLIDKSLVFCSYYHQLSLMAMIRHSFDEDVNQVLFEGNSYVKKVILNRPQKLNCLNHHMVSEITKKLKAYEIDPEVKVVVLKGNGKAFCAGGDVVELYICTVAGHWSYAASSYKKNLFLDYAVATYGKPVVALIHGIVMGSGAGLSMHATFKIVTENTVFAMPETAIGHFVDVGASYFLSRLPGFLGEYLGLTGAKIRGPDMVACGLATHFVLAKDLHLVESALDEVTSSDTCKISKIISMYEHTPNVKQNGVYSRLEIINKCFSRNTVEEILSSLESEAGDRAEKWILEAIKSMKAASPISLKISLKSIREGRTQSLDQCLARDYTICCHIMRRTVSIDYFEGTRAMLLDKENTPPKVHAWSIQYMLDNLCYPWHQSYSLMIKVGPVVLQQWEPARLELVSDEMVGRYFSRVDEDDWESLQLPVLACVALTSGQDMSAQNLQNILQKSS